MVKIISEDIERYCDEHSTPESPLFAKLANETYNSTEYPQMQVGHLEGTFLRMLIGLCQAHRVLELGTFTGYSSLAMAEALPADGTLITCDIDPETTVIARKYWDQSPAGRKIRLCLGDALETIRRLEGPFDLAFIDADKERYPAYWEEILPKMSKGGRVLNPEDDSDRAVAAFNKQVRKDARVEAVMLPIRDGMTLARVT